MQVQNYFSMQKGAKASNQEPANDSCHCFFVTTVSTVRSKIWRMLYKTFIKNKHLWKKRSNYKNLRRRLLQGTDNIIFTVYYGSHHIIWLHIICAYDIVRQNSTFTLNGWIQTLSRERVKSQSLGNLTFNSESTSKIMPVCEIWVFECMFKSLFFQKIFLFVLMEKVPQKWTNLKTFWMLTIRMS